LTCFPSESIECYGEDDKATDNQKNRIQLVHSKAAEIETNVDDKFVNHSEKESDLEDI
jgi:hypothetical protein